MVQSLNLIYVTLSAVKKERSLTTHFNGTNKSDAARALPFVHVSTHIQCAHGNLGTGLRWPAVILTGVTENCKNIHVTSSAAMM